MRRFLILSFALLFIISTKAQEVAYRQPPEGLERLLLADPTPMARFNADCSAMMLLSPNRAVPLSRVPLNELLLATVRINPAAYSRVLEKGFSAITLKQVPNGNEVKVSNLPEGGVILHATWYPTGDKILIFYHEADGVYLYAATLTEGHAERISNRRINTTAKKIVAWVSDTDFVTACVVEGGETPSRSHPTGPIVQENLGKQVRKRIPIGLLRDKFDSQALEYYFTSQLVRFSPSGEEEIGKPAIYRTVNSSPDGSLLMIYRVIKPYSNGVEFQKLRAKTTIEDLKGNVVKHVKQRNKLTWRPDKPATLAWVVNSKKNPDYKSSVYEQAAPFTEKRRLLVRTPESLDKIYWCDDKLALVVEKEKKTTTISAFVPGGEISKKIVSYSPKNICEDPGNPIMVNNCYGRKVLWTNAKHNEVLFKSEGYSPEGMMPKLTSYNLRKGKRKDIWQCKAPYFEKIIAVKNPDKNLFITSCESYENPKNYYLSNLKKGSRTALTNFVDLCAVKGVRRELLTYTRADGLKLKSFVWLPAGYDAKRDGKLPVLIWAYPHKFDSAEAADRRKYSQYTYPEVRGINALVTQGYCIIHADMPLIPTRGKKHPYETLVKQLTMNVEAAINTLSDAGYGDPDRVAVGGHSYGAFMTANLLSHTKLFKAGIACSGAYNRTLTPFSFQYVPRTYWNARRVFNAVAPFNHVPKLHGALLLIHGSIDQNTGTSTIQSERYFQALRGYKKYVRYVELPFEGHGYKIRENLLHQYYEINRWLEKYVKNVTPETEDK